VSLVKSSRLNHKPGSVENDHLSRMLVA